MATSGELLAAALDWAAAGCGADVPPLIDELPAEDRAALLGGARDLADVIAFKLAHQPDPAGHDQP